jgi:hypothetical protein
MPPQFKAISARRFKSQKALPQGLLLHQLELPCAAVLIPTRLISDPELPRQLRLFRLEFVLVITSLPPFITFHLQQATSYGAANMT